MKAYKKAWAKRKLLEDPIFALNRRMRHRIYKATRGLPAGRGTFRLLGYSIEELRTHIERQFVRGMSWKNMGEWHIDHILPLASFRIEAVGDSEFMRAWGLANLRPLWAQANFSKAAKIEVLL